MPSTVTTFDIYSLNACWSFTDLHQNDCVVPINEAIVTNVCGDGDCPFHGMLFFTCHDDFTHDLKTPRARILREMACKCMQNNPEDKDGHSANFIEQSGGKVVTNVSNSLTILVVKNENTNNNDERDRNKTVRRLK